MPAVAIKADVPGQGHFRITLAKTGYDSASLDVREWANGTDLAGPPTTDNSYPLKTVRVSKTLDVITCQTSSFWLTPVITFSLSREKMLPSVTVAITHALFANKTTTYPLTPADRVALGKFLVDSAFPAG